MQTYTAQVIENGDQRGRWVKVNAASTTEALEKIADECLCHGYSPDYGRIALGDYDAFVCVKTVDFYGNRISAGHYDLTLAEGGVL